MKDILSDIAETTTCLGLWALGNKLYKMEIMNNIKDCQLWMIFDGVKAWKHSNHFTWTSTHHFCSPKYNLFVKYNHYFKDIIIMHGVVVSVLCCIDQYHSFYKYTFYSRLSCFYQSVITVPLSSLFFYQYLKRRSRRVVGPTTSFFPPHKVRITSTSVLIADPICGARLTSHPRPCLILPKKLPPK